MLREKLKDHRIILASGSPRRHQFLNELDVPYIIDIRPVREHYPESLKGSEITNYLSELKAEVFQKE